MEPLEVLEERFDRDGFVILRKYLDSAELAEAKT